MKKCINCGRKINTNGPPLCPACLKEAKEKKGY